MTSATEFKLNNFILNQKFLDFTSNQSTIEGKHYSFDKQFPNKL